MWQEAYRLYGFATEKHAAGDESRQERPERSSSGTGFRSTEVMVSCVNARGAKALSRLGRDISTAPLKSGRCTCGNVGKPFVTTEGGIGFLCLSCFILEAKARITRASCTPTRFSKPGR